MITVGEYMNITGATEYQAQVAIDYINHCSMLRDSIKCPMCGEQLEVELGSYEEGYGDFVFCIECDFDDNLTEKYYPLTIWCGFDPILFDPEMFNDEQRVQELENQTNKRLEEMRKYEENEK